MMTVIRHANVVYREMLKKILAEGNDRGDRTDTGTRSLFGEQMKFDLTKGFPLLTTKKLSWKSIVHELLWLISGSTNIKYLQDNGVTIWDEWRQPYTLDRNIVVIKRKTSDYYSYSGDFSTLGVNASKGSLDERLAENWVRIMRRCYDPCHHGYSMYGAQKASVHIRWHDPKVFIEEVKLLPHWYYKAKNPDQFELDKDYYGANQYGLETCVWLRSDENNWYAKTTKPVLVVDGKGVGRIYLSQSEAARRIGMSHAAFARICKDGWPSTLKGANKKFAGWEFRTPNPNGEILRLELIEDNDMGPVYGKEWRAWQGNDGNMIDQLKDVIERIKTKPEDRRLIVTAWNPADTTYQALPPCHMMYQFYTRESALGGRTLDCHMYQRSADVFLGVPFNIASYALLTHLVAKVTKTYPGRLTISFGDIHVYSNHMDQVKEQITREPFRYKLPEVAITKDTRNIDDFTFDDIQLLGYEAFPSIKAQVAV